MDQIAVLANGAAVIAAFVGGVAADTWRFAVFLSVVAFTWFKGIAVAVGFLPEFANGYLFSSMWFASLAGNFIGATALGLFGHLVRRSLPQPTVGKMVKSREAPKFKDMVIGASGLSIVTHRNVVGIILAAMFGAAAMYLAVTHSAPQNWHDCVLAAGPTSSRTLF